VSDLAQNPPKRDELASFLPTHKLIRAFELLFQVAFKDQPDININFEEFIASMLVNPNNDNIDKAIVNLELLLLGARSPNITRLQQQIDEIKSYLGMPS